MEKQNLKKSQEKSKSKPRFFKRSHLLKGATLPKAIQFPKIYRIITDPFVSAFQRLLRTSPYLKKIFRLESFWVGIVAGIIIIGILIVGTDLKKNIAEKESIDTERSKILSEIKYWEDIAKKHKGYRDAYFKLALLEYKIGNIKGSKKYLNEVFRLDPNFEKAREFENIIYNYK